MQQVPGSESPNGRSHDLKSAVSLSIATIAWNVLAGGAAIMTAAAVGSLSLASFGLSAALDSVASVALVWRFKGEAKDPSRGHRLETVTVRIVGCTLIVVALYVAGQAIRSLRSHSGPDLSTMAVLIAGLSLVVLPPLALGKLRLATRLGSKALRGDGALTAVGATLAALTLLGLVLDTLFGWWWSDAGSALVMSALLIREGALALGEID